MKEGKKERQLYTVSIEGVPPPPEREEREEREREERRGSLREGDFTFRPSFRR